MCVCVCVCVCINIYTYICIYIHIYRLRTLIFRQTVRLHFYVLFNDAMNFFSEVDGVDDTLQANENELLMKRY